MSVILLGYHNMGCMALKVLKELGCDVPAVFTHRDNPNENRWFNSLSNLAKEMGIEVFYPENINTPKWIEKIRSFNPDIILSCYYRNLVKQEILDIPKIGAFNLHGSLLPKYRGRCPVNWQILNGEKKAGVTLHYMVVQADAGDIVGQKEVDIDEEDTAVTLFKKLEIAGRQLLLEMIPRLLDGSAPRIVQDHSKATYFGGRKPEDGIIDWSKSAREIYNLIRAVTWPYPGAFTYLNGKKIMIWWAKPYEEHEDNCPVGTVLEKDGDFFVQTGKGQLKLLTISEEGKSPDEKLDPKDILSSGVILGNSK